MARTKRPLILASGSPRRRILLKKLGIPFRVILSGINEEIPETNPSRLVRILAEQKAIAVAKRYPNCAVIGADTVVYCRGEILLKPLDKKDSERILNLLNGRWHKVYTGVALALSGGRRVYRAVCVSRTKARKLSQERLQRLVGKHMDKSGSYAMQDRRDPFIQKVIGGKDNVVGLPLSAVINLLKMAK
ncbi:MAG: Maf family protein [Elusimicrobiota bacterium]